MNNNRPHHLDSYVVNNTVEARIKLKQLKYKIKKKSYMDIEYYMKYPYIVLYNGYIEFCHTRHLNRNDLYGQNKKLELINGQFILNLG